MKKKKRWFMLCAVLALALLLGACSGGKGGASNETEDAVPEEVTSSKASIRPEVSEVEESVPEEGPGSDGKSFEVDGAVWSYTVVANADEQEELVGSMLTTIERFASNGDDERYIFVFIDGVDKDGEAQDLAALWEEIDKTKLAFIVDGETYSNRLAVSSEAEQQYFYTLSVPAKTADDVRVDVVYG